jgi:hypothetical protein
LPAHGSGGARATIELKAPQKNRAKPEKQKGKKEGGLGEGIFALLRLRIERFRFSLNKRNTKQKNFLFLLSGKRCQVPFLVNEKKVSGTFFGL